MVAATLRHLRSLRLMARPDVPLQVICLADHVALTATR